MGLPVLEWIPNGALDVTIEGENPGEPRSGTWAAVSGVADGWPKIQTNTNQPYSGYTWTKRLRFVMNSGGVSAIVNYPAIDGTTTPTEGDTWGFGAYARSTGGSIDTVKLQLVFNGAGSTSTTTLSTVTTTYQAGMIAAQVPASTTSIDAQITVDDAAALTVDLVALVAGRVVDFTKRVKIAPSYARSASQTVSYGNVHQTDLFHQLQRISVVGHDEDSQVRDDLLDLWDHAAVGRVFGLANDRADRANNWYYPLVLTGDSGLIDQPVGAYRYRLGLASAETQVLP